MYCNKFFKNIFIMLLAVSITTQSASAFSFNIFKKKTKSKETNQQVITPEEKEKGKKTFSLDECVEYAINNDPNIRISANNYEVQKSRVGQAKSDYFPMLGIGSGYNYQYSNSSGYTSSSMWRGSGGGNSNGYYQLNASVNQLIWNFGRTTAGINMQKFNRESAGYDLDYSILQTVYNVKTAYFAVLAALANVDIFERSVRINTLNYERTKAMFEEGLKSKIDVKKGYKIEEIVYILANLLDCSEQIIENKLKHVGEFTFQEAIKINSELFNNKMDIKYLFTEEQDNEVAYHDDIIQKSKPSKCWI